MKDPRHNICFIINPIAGRKKGTDVIRVIEAAIDTNKFKHTIFVSRKPGHVTLLADEAVNNGADIIVAVGGDGTVNEVARRIVKTNIILGIIPLGSGNGLAHYFKIPNDCRKAMEIINSMNVISMDTGTINGLFFISVAGIGFDATVAKEYKESGKRGLKTYLSSSIRNYFRYKPSKYKIRIGNQVISRRALLITFANSDQFGYNVSIAPEAKINDGLFDMCVMRKVPVNDAPFVIPKLLAHKIHRSKYHELFRAADITVFRKNTSVIHVDGEAVEMNSKIIHVVNHHQSLRVLVSENL